MLIREEAEIREARELSPLATLAAKSRGRIRSEEECSVRTSFQRDRDRIIHSKAFRRLKHKTQVFISPEDDHYRTRLTHTLEVAQIARTIARALCLNEDLTEAIALGHDLGHTPFGHTGEEALNKVFPGGFRHNEQSLRVVDVLEGGSGLNLTFEVRDGIVHHTGPVCPSTLEGAIVRLADRIAYINHDIDDALRAGIIAASDLPAEVVQVLGDSHSHRINTMVTDVIQTSGKRGCIEMSQVVGQATNRLRDFLFDRVYIGSKAKKEEAKVCHLVEELYVYFLAHSHELPPEYIHFAGGDVPRAACDYIAGMTDRFAKTEFLRCFFPRSFGDRLFWD
ncbi:MAG: deoxyguanosinetriphosphate triphosphohydrolase [Firmicutes bacterium]|nr:deoxyguanosinetriphosphate triphosphohydrolase [Bacillota bacterium]